MSDPAPETVDSATHLGAIRAQIDAIDDAILELIAQRGRSVGALAQLKAGSGSPLRPAREAVLMRRLLEQAGRKGLDADFVVEVWRALIAAGVRRQGGLEVLVAGAAGVEGARLFDTARKHFGALARVAKLDDPRAALVRVLESPACVAVMPFPGLTGPGMWWPILYENRYQALSIVAAAPIRCAPGQEPDAVIVARDVPIEPSGQDVTFGVAFDPHHRVVRALNDADIVGREWGRARDMVLVRVEEHLAQTDARIAHLVRAGLDGFRVVGSFPRA